MAQSAAGEYETERRRLVSATATTVELPRAAKLRANHNERFFEEPFFLKIRNQRGECVVEFADEDVLIELTGIVRVPAGTIDEIQIVRDLNKADAGLHQPTREEAALAELAAVALADRRGLLAEFEVTHESRASEAEGFALHFGVIGQHRVVGRALLQGLEQALAGG